MLSLFLTLACTTSPPAGPGDVGAGDSPDSGTTDGGTTDSVTTDSGATDSGATDSGTTDSGATDSGTPGAPGLSFDGDATGRPLLGLGAQVWAGDDRWPAALDPMGATLVRVALNPNLGSRAVVLPVDASPETWDAWMADHVLDEAPDFLTELQETRAATDARGIRWIAHQWEAPPAWETGGVLRAEHVDDYAAMWGALLGWVVDQGIRPAWIELSNEPDGTWNSYISPEHYDALVVQVRAELDRRGLEDVGIVGPGLSILGSWTPGAESPWVPALSDEAVSALAAWSAHTWDGYAEDEADLSGPAFLADRWAGFLAQVRARDPDKPIIATEVGSKDLRFDGVTYGDPGPDTCGASTESHGYAIRVLAHTAVALAAGVDGLIYWEAADQDWACSRWGLVDADGQPRPVHEALSAFTSALPPDGRVVVDDAAPLPAVAVLGDSAGVVLVVNEGDETWEGTVAVSGWDLAETRGFGVESRRQRDELSDLDQLSAADDALAVDASNPGEFLGDAGRLYRTEEGSRQAIWAPGGTLLGGEIVAWSWSGEEARTPTVAVSADGATWTVVAPTATVDTPGWRRHRLALEDLPDGARQLRLTLEGTGPAWSPQVGDLALDWARVLPGSLPTGEAPWHLLLPPDSAAILVLSR